MILKTLNLVDNPSIKGREDKYQTITVNLNTVIESWKISLFSFEWLTPEGQIRTPKQLPEKELVKYEAVLSSYAAGTALEKPILGLGIVDNIEIGSRRDVLLTLASQNVATLDVHISKSMIKDFIPYFAS